jgi:8-oxo-dGTP pyrophosphatase MutT (NUDIX family)
VILVRPRGAGPGLEIFLLRRHRGASFMSSAFVFPGGVADADEADPRTTAARELFEEAGALLIDRPIDATTRAAWRAAVNGGAPLAPLLEAAGARLALDELAYFARWITPSIEPRRYDATFFVAALPAGQEVSPDDRETVEQVWVTPGEGLARAGELRLPPPQIRTLLELEGAAAEGLGALRALCSERARAPHAILPRVDPGAPDVTLLLPWDAGYPAGTGDLLAMPADHPLARGPSRFVLRDGAWDHTTGPSPRT